MNTPTNTPRTGLVTIAKSALEHLSKDTLMCYIDQLERELGEARQLNAQLVIEAERRKANMLDCMTREGEQGSRALKAEAQLATLRAEKEKLAAELEEQKAESKYRGEMSDSWRKSYGERLDEVHKLRGALMKIRNSAGEQVMVCTTEGHSFCVHTASAALNSTKKD